MAAKTPARARNRGRPPKRGDPPPGWKQPGHPGVFVESYEVGEIAEALLKCAGILSNAAEELGCKRATLVKYLERHPDLAKVRDHAREVTLDLAESKLVDKIKKGNLGAIIFFLKTQGKQRGYVERQQLQAIPSRVNVYLPEPDARDLPHNARVIESDVDAPALPSSQQVASVEVPANAARMKPAELDALGVAMADSDGAE